MSKEIHLGNQAKRILEDEIFTDAVKKIEELVKKDNEIKQNIIEIKKKLL